MRRKLGYVTEADVDLVLVLDAWSGGPLIRHLATRAGLQLGIPLEAARSTIRAGGTRETDVEVTWPGGSLLIEDKVDAAFTPGQPASYQLEVSQRRASGDVAASVLVCPGRRLVRLEGEADGAFDLVITCEELAEVAESADDTLSEAAAVVLRAAAESRPTRPQNPVDQVRSDWGDEYRRIVAELLPPGARLDPGPGSLRTATAEVCSFLTTGIDPPAIWVLAHWIPGGHVRMEVLALDEPSGLPEGVELVRKRKMCWLVSPTPAVTFDRPAAAQRDEIARAVQAALDLRAWAAGAGLRAGPNGPAPEEA